MKMKIQLLAMMMIAAFAFTACSDDDDNVAVPETVSAALQAKYPSATQVEWETKGNYFVADCRLNNRDADVWFDANGSWMLTETEIVWGDLPVAVQEAFNAGEYATWQKEDFDMLEYPSSSVLYVIEVEQGKTEIQLFYKADGTLDQTKDVSNTDDTHWPAGWKTFSSSEGK